MPPKNLHPLKLFVVAPETIILPIIVDIVSWCGENHLVMTNNLHFNNFQRWGGGGGGGESHSSSHSIVCVTTPT